MGLDMYLYQNHSLADYNFVPVEKEIANKMYSILGVDDIVEHNNSLEIKVPVAYWRKANAIHAWFVKNIQHGEDDCKEYYASHDKLLELRKICEEVLEDRSKAEELLPCATGFFFGSSEYDEWYFKDIEYTLERLNILLDEDNKNTWVSYYYQASW